MRTRFVFNKEFEKYIKNNDSELSRFLMINAKNDYFNFLDDFLGDYGINSISWSTSLNEENEYIPYINCNIPNILNEPLGIKKLSHLSLSSNDCEKAIADYLISKLTLLDMDDFEKFQELREEIEKIDLAIRNNIEFLAINAQLLYMNEREVDGAYYEMSLSNDYTLGITTEDFSVVRYEIQKIVEEGDEK